VKKVRKREKKGSVLRTKEKDPIPCAPRKTDAAEKRQLTDKQKERTFSRKAPLQLKKKSLGLGGEKRSKYFSEGAKNKQTAVREASLTLGVKEKKISIREGDYIQRMG